MGAAVFLFLEKEQTRGGGRFSMKGGRKAEEALPQTTRVK